MPPRPAASVQPPKGKPWGQVAAPAPSGRDRKLVFDGRVLATVQEWNGAWGWLVPLQKISHPQFRGKIYAHRTDLKAPSVPAPGATVDFLLYSDSRGLGAGDVRPADPATAQAVGAEADGAQEEELPRDWEKVFSEEHSDYYYWNRVTKESSWVPPEPEGAAEDDDDDLPDGWTQHFDSENNQFYFWHAPTKTTTWERPKAPAKDAQPEEEEQAPEPEAEVRAAPDGPVLGQERVQGRVDKWQGFFGWITPTQELSDDLKPLLENRQDRIYCNWRDVQEGTTMKAGLLVDFLLYADDTGLGASEVRLRAAQEKPASAPRRGAKRAAPKDAVAELARQWAQQDAELGEEEEPAEEPAAGVAEVADMDAPLLPGWEQHWSDEHGCHYYWHKAAKQASWERPCVPTDPANRSDKVWEGEGAEEGASRLATPITPVTSQAGKEITPLTPATAADQSSSKPSAGFRAAQAAGMFRGLAGKGGAPAAPKPSVPKRPAQPARPPPQAAKGKGRGASYTPYSAWSQAAAKRQRAY